MFGNVSKVVLCGRQAGRQAQHFRRVVLRVFANRIGRAASSGDKVQILWQAWHFVRCDEN